MTFDEVLTQIIDVLKRQGRVSYGALKRRYDLDDAYLEDLKGEILYVHESDVQADDRGFTWVGEQITAPPQTSQQPTVQATQPTVESPPSESRPPEAERRQLTVMFCDLVDSTKLSSQLDPEDYRDVVREYQRVCSEVIQRYEGHIAQYLGDGLLVYFGYPQSHEDEAQRAIYTGLGILSSLTQLNARLEQDKDIRLALRIGIHTGLVVVGDIGEGSRQEQLALGETPNIAARIQGLAEPDTVVMSEATYRLIQGYFDCKLMGEQSLRGVSQPLPVYQVLQESSARSRLEVATTRGLTPLVGREQEVGLLLARWEQAKTRQGQVILLSGEAGIGKSRLVQVLKDHLADEPHTRWECWSSPYYQNTALYPIIDLIQRTLRWQQDDTPEQRVERLERQLSQHRLSLEETVPLFAPLLSLSLSEDRYPPLVLSPQRQRQKTLEAILAIMLKLSERQPVLFILEDLHWTDPTTLELLALLLEHTPTASLYILATCRPEFQPSWSHRSYLTEITVNPLTRHQIEQMAMQVAGGKPLPTEVIGQLVERTDGVPLYVEEMTKAILGSGVLKETDEQYELVGSLSSLSIPMTLQDSLMARLDRLITAKAVAQYASVIGRQFSYELLHAVSQLDEATLQQELGRLIEAELVYPRGLPPQATYVFKHALIRDAAYESLVRRTRQGYHLRIAEVFEERFPETAETQLELLAHHYTAAELHPQALTAWQQAGAQAMTRSAYREAVTCFEQALNAVPHLPENEDTYKQTIDLWLDLRNSLQPLGEFRRVDMCLRGAQALAETLGDQHRLGWILSYRTNCLWLLGDYDHALQAGRDALRLAAMIGSLDLQIRTNLGFSQVHSALGNYRQAQDALQRNITLMSVEYSTSQKPFDPRNTLPVFSRVWLVWSLADCGGFAEAISYGEEAIQIAESSNDPFILTHAYAGIGHLFLRKGDLEEAISALEHALEICYTANIQAMIPSNAFRLGHAYTLSGRIAEALRLLEQATEQSDSMGDRRNYARHIAWLSEAYLRAGRVEDALRYASRAQELARAQQERGNLAWILQLFGEISSSYDFKASEKAEAYYRQALVLADELGMRPLQAHCHRGLGTLYRQTGQAAQARAALSTAIDMYREMEMTFWVPETEAALAVVESKA